MRTSDEIGIIDENNNQNSTQKHNLQKNFKKRGNTLDNLKSSLFFKDPKRTKNKLNQSKQKNQISNIKKVKFNKDINIIDVESWKKYNVELTAGETPENLAEEENNKDKKNKDEKEDNKKNKKEHITCVCLIF